MTTHHARAGMPGMSVRRSLLATVGAAIVLAGGLVAPAEADRPAVTAWAGHHAEPLTSVDPAAPLGDLAPLRRSVGDARIVGLGESAHGASEELTLKHRALRYLVERLGFRSVAWEDDWTVGRKIDRYVRTGRGRVRTLVGQMSPQWQFGEVAEVLRWLREYNEGRADKVRFVGVEYYVTRRLAYDAVDDYVARAAPGSLRELRRHLRPIRPRGDIWEYARWYQRQQNKAPYVRHARQVYRLVAGLRPHEGRRHALALHNARQIRSFYIHYTLPNDGVVYRDAQAARNVRWWRELSGDRIAYWAASPHTAVAPKLRIVMPDRVMRFPSAGSYLRDWYGDRYRSIGFTFDHGAIGFGEQVFDMPPPEERWFEHPLGAVRAEQFVLDLRHPAPLPVRSWLTEPATTRGPGPGATVVGGSPGQWFDVIVHRQEVSPAGTP